MLAACSRNTHAKSSPSQRDSILHSTTTSLRPLLWSCAVKVVTPQFQYWAVVMDLGLPVVIYVRSVPSLAACLTARSVQNSGHHAQGSVDFRSAVHRRTPATSSDDAVSAVHRSSASLCAVDTHCRLRTSGTHYRMTFVTPVYCQRSVPD